MASFEELLLRRMYEQSWLLSLIAPADPHGHGREIDPFELPASDAPTSADPLGTYAAIESVDIHVTSGQAAALLSLSTGTVRRWCDSGVLPHRRHGSKRMLPLNDVLRRRELRKSLAAGGGASGG